MTDRLYFWGLSNGIIVLAIAGTFWLGMGFGPHLGGSGWVLPAVFTVVLYGSFAAIVWLAVRLRRRVGFKRSDLRQGDERQRAETRRIMIGFLRIAIAQTVLVVLAVLLCLCPGREAFLAPSIAFIVSLHFIPPGRIFHVRTYYVVGGVGCVLSLLSVSTFVGGANLTFLGGTMGVLL